MGQLFVNNFKTELAGDITADSLIIAIDNGNALPMLSSGEFFVFTLIGTNASGKEDHWEIVKANTVVNNSIHVERAQEGTQAQAWPVGTKVEARLTAGAAMSFTQNTQNISIQVVTALPEFPDSDVIYLVRE